MTTVQDPRFGDPAATDGTQVVAAYRRHLSLGRAMFGEMTGSIVETRSAGALIYDERGRDYLDCGGYGVFIHGHRHPAVLAAVQRQLETHPLATRVLLEPVTAQAATALARVSPEGLDRVHFANSGAEAMETALKLARAHGKVSLVATHGGFHGKTLGALSATGNPLYKDAFHPLLPDTCHVPYGDAEALREALAARKGRACVVVEPVQGEAGVVVPPHGYLQQVQAACREYGAFFVVDEVQTGMGRLGTWWGLEPEGVVPDAMLVAKGLSGGVVPVAAVVASQDAYRPFNLDPYLHSSTFAGSPLACAAALAAVESLEAEGLVARAAETGARLLTAIEETLRQRCGGLLREVRGRGLLIGAEFTHPMVVGELLIALLRHGVIVNHSLNNNYVLRFTPPAVLTAEDEARLLSALDSAAVETVQAVTTATGDTLFDA